NIREFYIGFLLNFLLLQGYLSKTPFNKKGLFLISVLAIIMSETMEFNFIISAMLILYYFLYSRKYKNDINNTAKKCIAAFSVIPLLYIPAKAIITIIYLRPTATGEWLNCVQHSLSHLTNSILLSSVFAIIAVLFLLFCKKDITIKSSPYLICFFLFGLFVFNMRVGFSAYQFSNELNGYMFSVMVFFVLYILILAGDYYNFKMSDFNAFFYKNLIIIGCIFGILNSLWQIHNCTGQGKYLAYLKDVMKQSNEVIAVIPPEKFTEKGETTNLLKAAPPFGTILTSILLSDDYIIGKVIFPKNYRSGEINYSEKNYTHFNQDANILIIEEAPLSITTTYWNLLPIAEELINKKMILPDNQQK
ncbi:MAG: hypothetical protein K6C94_06015, partial [Candidatus Gastranaerophilales bacterium]|nr:hypothetical protein [Candidatus Gastranaerophilales bacterium]